ncbi:Uncharacterized protein DBV15_09325, partial [Temnothorax longispinosus]
MHGFRGNREWKEGALIGPSLPLIVLYRLLSSALPRRQLSQLALIRPAYSEKVKEEEEEEVGPR